MKRLLCIISAMNTGGAETFLMKMYRALNHDKYQMDFCVNIDDNFYAEEIASLGGKIYKVPVKSIHPFLWYRETKRIISENQYEYALRVSEHSLAALDLWVAKKAGATRVVMRSSNASSENKTSVILHRLFMPLARIIPTVKIAPSLLAAEYTFGKGCVERGEAHILQNGFAVKEYKYSEELRKEYRKLFGVANCYVLGHIGRFSDQKNHFFLLKVFSEVVKSQPDARLLLIGDGPLMQEVEEKAKQDGIDDKIIFAGVRSDVPQMLNAFDVFVFPSKYEGMPNTVLEAQANGLHCVISDRITREANVTGNIDYLPISDTQLWSEKIVKYINTERDKQAIERLCDKGYDIEDCVSKFCDFVFGG